MADLAEARLGRLEDAFGDRLYVELQRHGLDSEIATEPALIDLADRLGLPLVATNEPYFAAASDYEAHDALLCIAEGRCSRPPSGGGSRPSTGSRPAPRWSSCSPTCPRRSRRASRSPCAAPTGR